MQLTIDSNEPLDRVLKVVSSLYGVELALVSTSGQFQNESATAPAAVSAPRSRNRRAAKASPAKASPAGTSPAKASPAGTSSAKTSPAQKAVAGRGASRRSSVTDLAAVRSWARANGFKVSDRGRVSNAVLKAFQESDRSTS
jgi:hypothetical protein